MNASRSRLLAMALTALLAVLLLSGCAARVTELSGPMTAEELRQLDRYKNLRSLDLRGSDCYDEIEAYIAAHPQVEVLYSIALEGVDYPPDVKELRLSGPEAIAELRGLLPHFKALEKVSVDGAALDASQVRALRSALPGIALDYRIALLGEAVSPELTSLELSELSPEQKPQVLLTLPLLEKLQSVRLDPSIALEDFIDLRRAAPQADFDYSFELFGQSVSTQTKELSYTGVQIGNRGAQLLERLLPCLDKLEKLTVDDCGVSDPVMARLRDALPDKQIVWRVAFGWGRAWSDTIKIWAIGGFNNQQLRPLKYCTKVKYLDLGHNGITEIEFVRSMPELEVLILENDDIEDISALEVCKNLEYLEVGETQVKDITPLAGCVSLRHLNIGGLHQLTDISPLYGLEHLERLYGICSEKVPPEQVEYIKSLMPDCEIRFEYDPKGPVNGAYWRWRDGHMVPRYQLLHDQIGYNW